MTEPTQISDVVLPPGKRRRYSLSSMIEAKRAEKGVVEIEAGGETFTVDPPELWSDDVLTSIQGSDYVAAARALLTPDAYARFVAAGGSASLLLAVVAEQDQGVTPGE